MRSKVLAVRSIPETTENRAKWCHLSGHSPSWPERVEPHESKSPRGWLMTSRSCLILTVVAGLMSLVGCSSGSNSGGGNSGGGTPNPFPSISSITPPNANEGGSNLTITVTGEGFVSASTLNWNGTSRITTEVSDTQVTATVTAADIAAAGAAQITVVNPAPGGGTSNPVGFVINGTEAAATPGFVYVANSIGVSLTMGNISVFSVDPSTGGLTPVPGSPFQGGAQPTAAAVDPFGKFLFEASNIDNLVPAKSYPRLPSTLPRALSNRPPGRRSLPGQCPSRSRSILQENSFTPQTTGVMITTLPPTASLSSALMPPRAL